jgi:hypothetical protein
MRGWRGVKEKSKNPKLLQNNSYQAKDSKINRKTSNKILIFHSTYIFQIIELVYLKLIEWLIGKQNIRKSILFIVRNDSNSKFIACSNNVSGISFGRTFDEIDALSFQFYQYLNKYGCQNRILFGNTPLYDIYTRQVKLRLAEAIKTALQVHEWSLCQDKNIEIVSDAQTIAIIYETLSFLGVNNKKIKWKRQSSLTFIVTVNSVLMRLAAVIKTTISKSKLPKTYYKNQYNQHNPTVLVTLPSSNSKRFFNSYVKKINHFNVILYSIGHLEGPPNGYESIPIKITNKSFLGLFSIFECCSVESFIADVLLIYNNHVELETCINACEVIFDNERIDVLLNRQQCNIVNNYFAILARKLNISIVSDVFEEVYTCDAAILGCEANLAGVIKLALGNCPYVVRGVNEFMKYRLFDFKNTKPNYIQSLLNIEKSKKIIFYASDPGKEEKQRYESECFLIHQFSLLQNICLVIKTHRQDSGKVTLLAYNQSNRPENVKLIGDAAHESSAMSSDFCVFPDFDFNAALVSSDGFITSYSSSAMQALALNVKTGILDMVNHGFMRPMIEHGGAVLIDDKGSLEYFLNIDEWCASDDAIKFYGLQINVNNDFDLGRNLLELAGFSTSNL